MNKLEATNKAKKLKKFLEEMFPKSIWNMEVWENMGWHYKVHCGTVGVYAHDYPRDLTYSLACGSEVGNTTATPYNWSLSKSVKTIPEIKGLVEEQLEHIRQIAKDIEDISRYNYESIMIR